MAEPIKTTEFDSIVEDMSAALTMANYEAVEVLWVALVKFANLLEGNSEHARMLKLVDRIPIEAVHRLLFNPSVDGLLNVDPALETVLANPNERLNFEQTSDAIQQVSTHRETEPKRALMSLGEILKRIRNKREHGFKTRSGPRDREILDHARVILKQMCEDAAEVLDPN